MCSDGTRDSLGRIVDQYSPMLLRLAMTRLTQTADAEDCVQEVFLKLLERRPVFRDPEHEKAWLIRATLNQACDLWRTRRRQVSLDALPETAESAHCSLLSAVRALPDKYSAVIHLHYYEGYTIKEIATMLALPAATVGTRLARGRTMLKTILKEEES